MNGVDASRERAIGHFHRWETFVDLHMTSMGFRHVWETNREGAFALHMRVRVNNGENTLTFFLHLRAVYYEGKVEALHVSLSPDGFRYPKPMFCALWRKRKLFYFLILRKYFGKLVLL